MRQLHCNQPEAPRLREEHGLSPSGFATCFGQNSPAILLPTLGSTIYFLEALSLGSLTVKSGSNTKTK
jgi:hypothetical protein